MPFAIPGRALWAILAVLLFGSALALLHACDFNVFPLFAHKYCSVKISQAWAGERERNAQLREELRLAELRYAEKPKCAPPAPLERHAQVEPTPTPTPPIPTPTPTPTQEGLKVPTKLADLRGCWESVRGDLPIVTDDAEKRPIGNVRKCYCFGADGHGLLKLLYTNGVRCRAGLTAVLRNGDLQMSYPEFGCHYSGKEWGLVPGKIDCHNGDDDAAATCDTQDFGRSGVTRGTEQYRRVEQDHCGG